MRSLPCLSTVALAALLLCTATAISPPSKPHVVVLLADDLGYADCGYTGMSDVRTPAIDALLARGARLSRYYGQPVCSPSRAALHTGRLPLAMGLQTYVIGKCAWWCSWAAATHPPRCHPPARPPPLAPATTPTPNPRQTPRAWITA